MKHFVTDALKAVLHYMIYYHYNLSSLHCAHILMTMVCGFWAVTEKRVNHCERLAAKLLVIKHKQWS